MTGCLIVSSRVLLTSPFCPVPVYISNAILVREVFTMVYATLPAMLPGCFSSQAMAQMKRSINFVARQLGVRSTPEVFGIRVVFVV